MRVDDFDYELPDGLIADRPLENRSDSRLMVIDRATESIEHRSIRELPALLSAGDLMVLNNTRVIPARLFGFKRGGGARIEILLLEQREPFVWEALAQRAIRLSEGTVVEFSETESCEALEVLSQGRFVFRFDVGPDWEAFLDRHGEIPLPPYVARKRETLPRSEKDELDREDRTRYQTAYAAVAGSAAAPTAGLHFDEALFAALAEKGIERAEITLHVGLDTFSPVTVEEVEDHEMKTEWCEIPSPTVDNILETKKRGSKLVAVGSTSTRTLETYAREDWPRNALRSSLFLKPGDSFFAVDALLTNFHLPRSTLLMMISAFMGIDVCRRAYEEAVRGRYRFYSYGDAMLIL